MSNSFLPLMRFVYHSLFFLEDNCSYEMSSTVLFLLFRYPTPHPERANAPAAPGGSPGRA